MNFRNYLIALLLVMPMVVFGQHRRMKKKDSKAAGTGFIYWGYNRSAYTKSDIRFVGPDYDFTLANSVAKDRPEPFSAETYLNPRNLTVPQFNIRAGYYIRDHWAISLGYDHMKYVYQERNTVYLSGYIGEGVDPVTSWEGTYSGEELFTVDEYFQYENTDGLNYLRLEVTRTDHLFESRDPLNRFVISSNVGVGLGGLLSFNDFKFAGEHTTKTVSMSGYGVSASAGLRFEFFRHLFLQGTMSGGFHHQVKVQTRPNDPTSYARHKYMYAAADVALGFLFYIRPTNGCNTCPVW